MNREFLFLYVKKVWVFVYMHAFKLTVVNK